MPEFSGSFSGRATLQTTIIASDVPDHQLNLAEIRGLQKSSDEKWNNARLTYWGFADLVSASGLQRGHFINEHADGDQHWGTFEGKVTTVGSETTLEGTWAFSGGRGKFTGITGQGTYKDRMPSAGEVEMSWEGRYELAVSARAA
jgi:hypothetical protein